MRNAVKKVSPRTAAALARTAAVSKTSRRNSRPLQTDCILTINSGSSSLKLGLYRAGTAEPQLLYRGATDAIGKSGGALTITDSSGKAIHHEDATHDSQSSAFAHAAQKLEQLSGAQPVTPAERLTLNETLGSLRAHALTVVSTLPDDTPAILLAAPQQDAMAYRVGFQNFYVITRYNGSPLYAMAVHDLAQAIKDEVDRESAL